MLSPVHSTMMKGLSFLGVMCLAANSAAAQTSSIESWQDRQAVAGYSTVGALSNASETVDFFIDFRGSPGASQPPQIEYVARRTFGQTGDDVEVEWATSQTCPAMRNILSWMTGLVAPRIEIAGLVPADAGPAGRRPVTVYADGLSTTVWGRGTQPDHTAYTRVEISSNGGLIAEFGREANAALAPCWKTSGNDQP